MNNTPATSPYVRYYESLLFYPVTGVYPFFSLHFFFFCKASLLRKSYSSLIGENNEYYPSKFLLLLFGRNQCLVSSSFSGGFVGVSEIVVIYIYAIGSLRTICSLLSERNTCLFFHSSFSVFFVQQFKLSRPKTK